MTIDVERDLYGGMRRGVPERMEVLGQLYSAALPAARFNAAADADCADDRAP